MPEEFPVRPGSAEAVGEGASSAGRPGYGAPPSDGNDSLNGGELDPTTEPGSPAPAAPVDSEAAPNGGAADAGADAAAPDDLVSEP